jgi:putative endonuclease
MKGYVYILRSLKTNRYYIGSTNDIKRRIQEHQQGRTKATKYLLPIELKFYQQYESLTLARKIEYKIKKLKRKDIIDKIIKEKNINMSP